MDIVMIGIDLGKNLCSVAGMDTEGRIVLRRRMRRKTVAEFVRRWRPAWWRWKLAAARITSGGSRWRQTMK